LMERLVLGVCLGAICSWHVGDGKAVVLDRASANRRLRQWGGFGHDGHSIADRSCAIATRECELNNLVCMNKRIQSRVFMNPVFFCVNWRGCVVFCVAIATVWRALLCRPRVTGASGDAAGQKVSTGPTTLGRHPGVAAAARFN
jgi:hypothetical protein